MRPEELALGAQGILSFRPSHVPPIRCGPTSHGALPSTHCRLGREFGAGTWEHRSVLRFSRAALTLPEHSSSVAGCFPGASSGDEVCSAHLHTGFGPLPGKPRPLYRAVSRATEVPPPQLSLICRWWVSYEFPLPSLGLSIGDG